MVQPIARLNPKAREPLLILPPTGRRERVGASAWVLCTHWCAKARGHALRFRAVGPIAASIRVSVRMSRLPPLSFLARLCLWHSRAYAP
jgi:hypothetical protein